MFQYLMLRFPLTSSGPSVARFLTFLAGLFVLATTVLPAPAAEAKSTKFIELGAKNLNSFKPNCGRDFTRDCRVEGKVTMFQALSAKYPGRNFVVPFNGKLVAWSISLSRPTAVAVEDNLPQLPTFNEIFGSPSQAGIAILRQVEKKKKNGPRYKLVRRSPVEVLNPYFGTRVTFALQQPLNVYEGNIVALTIPTWVPAFWSPRVCNDDPSFGNLDPARCAVAQKRYTWRGSRVPRGEEGKETCNLGRNDDGTPNEQLARTAPQTGINSVRRYSCYYGGSVLLYSATIVGN